MNHIIVATAIYQDGVLKLLGSGPPPGLAEGDRVELAILRAVPAETNATHVASWEQSQKERAERLAALPPDPDDLSYEEGCKALDEHRPEGQKLFPPELKGVTW